MHATRGDREDSLGTLTMQIKDIGHDRQPCNKPSLKIDGRNMDERWLVAYISTLNVDWVYTLNAACFTLLHNGVAGPPQSWGLV